MSFAKLLCVVAMPMAAADQTCHSLSPTVSDAWCTSNCNHQPPNCPANLCSCSAGPPGPSPGPIPPPVWPGPPPSPPPLPPPPGPDSGCSADQIKAHCTKCGDSKCTACAQGYGINTDGTCIAACLLPGYSKQSPPQKPGIYNGIQWVDECIDGTEEHFFGIGDWGGLTPGVPAPNTHGNRPVNPTIDNAAQNLVANVMNAQAEISKPKFVVNVGDNFYWGGVDFANANSWDAEHCGDFVKDPSKACNHYRFQQYYDNIYNAPSLANAPWFTVFGNHDWGGYAYETGWDGQIYKTWCPGTGSDGFNRWRMPGMYWRQKVQFRDFSVDFFMMDGNMNDVIPGDLNHNICQRTHNMAQGGVCNVPNATLRHEKDCSDFLHKLWKDGTEWLKAGLATSSAEWQIVVIHYPPIWQKDFWHEIAGSNSGLDLLITGHTHVQELHLPGEVTNPMKNFTIPWLITGGGGGVTSEGEPDTNGKDDQYGFVDFTINKDTINIEMHSHGGTAHDKCIRRQASISPIPRKTGSSQEPVFII